MINKNPSIKGIIVHDRGSEWSVEISRRSFSGFVYVLFTLLFLGLVAKVTNISSLFMETYSLRQLIEQLAPLIICTVMVWFSLENFFGKTILSVKNGKAKLSSGIGKLRFYRHFQWHGINRIAECEDTTHRRQKYISLEGRNYPNTGWVFSRKRLNFGWGLNEEKRQYIIDFLRSKLVS